MAGLLDIFGGPVTAILDKIIPDPQKKRELQLELAKLQDASNVREHEETMGQLEVNKVEAAHASVFVAGWRPFIGWVLGTGCAVAFVVNPLLRALGFSTFDYPVDSLLTLLGGMLGWSGIRSFDKVKGIAFTKLGENPGMTTVTEVQGKATPQLVDKLPVATEPEGTPAKVEVSKTAAAPFTPVASTEPAAPSSSEREILWGAKVSEEFKAGVLWIEDTIGLSADNLMCCMAFETGQKFTPDVKNLAGSSGTGLIQFMAFTAERLGTTVEKLAKMSAVQQLSYVYHYFRMVAKDLGKSQTDFSDWTLEDTYMAILYPKAVGKPNSWPFPWAQSGLSYRQNRGLDLNKDGIITKAEASAGVRRMAELGAKMKG